MGLEVTGNIYKYLYLKHFDKENFMQFNWLNRFGCLNSNPN